ncbi:S1/P1 Nuclease [Alteromonadaceae bacterium Bs31]|nr:S1/P1 Nuclease [Alteromonadaceae bacterium Bs31]
MSLLKKKEKAIVKVCKLKTWVYCCVVSLCCFSATVTAWSPQGHGIIAINAYRNLRHNDPAAANTFMMYARLLYKHQKGSSKKLYGQCLGAKELCYLAQWPDFVKKVPLKDLWPNLAPELFKAYLPKSTASWHYHNNFYSHETHSFIRHCTNSGKLLEVLPLLVEAFEREANTENQAVILSFIVHLVGDAHQPLHSVSAINHGCEHDLGGNRVCIQKKHAKCERSLHALWDDGAGLFRSPQEFTLTQHIKAGTSDFESWITESSSYVGRVYLQDRNYDTESYKTRVQTISRARVKKAVANLEGLLVALMSKK